jgi:hypothetical protein
VSKETYYTLYNLPNGDVGDVDLALRVKDNNFSVLIAGDVKALCIITLSFL